MKITKMYLMTLGVAGFGIVACQDGERALASDAQEPVPEVREQPPVAESPDADQLHDLVMQARADLRQLRVEAGLGIHMAAPQAGRAESRAGGEGEGEHVGREGGEERGGDEHGHSGEGGGEERAEGEEGEEEGAYVPKMTKQNRLFVNGARLVLEFDPRTQVFVGSVTNTTPRVLPQVRVEVHLDNGTELGPTRRVDVAPGQTVAVELGAFGNEFGAWVSHPEAGVEEGHGGGGGEESGEGAGEHGGEGRGEEAGEHGGGEDSRPGGAAFRPVYNQLQILRGEMQAFAVDLVARSGRDDRE